MFTFSQSHQTLYLRVARFDEGNTMRIGESSTPW
jgi:hypothetical protein